MADTTVRRRRGALMVEIDYSDLSSRMAGISAENIIRLPEFKKLTVAGGMVVKETVVKAARKAIPNDPRKAIEGIRMGTGRFRCQPIMFVAIYDDKTVADTSAPRVVRKRPRKRSKRTEMIESYYGRSRAFVLRFQNSGTKSRKGKEGEKDRIKAKNFMRVADPAMRKEAPLWVKHTIDLINKEFRK